MGSASFLCPIMHVTEVNSRGGGGYREYFFCWSPTVYIPLTPTPVVMPSSTAPPPTHTHIISRSSPPRWTDKTKMENDAEIVRSVESALHVEIIPGTEIMAQGMCDLSVICGD